MKEYVICVVCQELYAKYCYMVFVLCSSETMAVRDAVLSQSPEFKEARIRAYSNASAVYDLLTVALVRWGQIDLLTEVSS